jgi:hypothetical protein
VLYGPPPHRRCQRRRPRLAGRLRSCMTRPARSTSTCCKPPNAPTTAPCRPGSASRRGARHARQTRHVPGPLDPAAPSGDFIR